MVVAGRQDYPDMTKALLCNRKSSILGNMLYPVNTGGRAILP